MRYGIIAILLLALTSPASARHYRHHHRYHHHYRHNDAIKVNNLAEGLGHGLAHMLDSARPRDCYGIPWCGCWLRHHLGISDKDYNRAVEWRRYGHAANPHIGAIVVWWHHVGIITGGHPGNWIITSGNDGHAVRSRRRSIAGAIAIRA